MEPGHEDREYLTRRAGTPRRLPASMEPGHEDREYTMYHKTVTNQALPQWSPVMKTGNTRRPPGPV